MHRGVARRTVFESRRDMRFFLAQLARVIRRRLIEVHAFVLMNTHFHLLVRSVGALSDAMRRVLNAYVRYFNRSRKRDGALFAGRFLSKPVRSLAYRRAIVRYIDHNPVRAGMAAAAELYPWGSARCYQAREGPVWLARHWIESEVLVSTGAPFDPNAYGVSFPPRPSDVVCDWVADGVAGRAGAEDDLDDLLGATPSDVRAWRERKARLADGTGHGCRVVAPETVASAIARYARAGQAWTAMRSPGGPALDARQIALVGLLTQVAGATRREIAVRERIPTATVHGRLLAHRRAMDSDDAYVTACATIVSDALAQFAVLVGSEDAKTD
jgi:REP element-mobilizing transposase RayT